MEPLVSRDLSFTLHLLSALKDIPQCVEKVPTLPFGHLFCKVHEWLEHTHRQPYKVTMPAATSKLSLAYILLPLWGQFLPRSTFTTDVTTFANWAKIIVALA